MELIQAEDRRLDDDAYVQGIRDEILGKKPFHGEYARRMGLLHIASRRISHENGDVLFKHTGPKRDPKTKQIIKDACNRMTYYPRVYIVRQVPNAELEADHQARLQIRKKVLNTCCTILLRHEKDKKQEEQRNPYNQNSPQRNYPPTQFKVPEDWDMTPETLHALDWYVTDQMVAKIIECMYVEQDIGRWDMFAENVLEAHCFFSPPYQHTPKIYGYRNPGESSVRHVDPTPPRVEIEQEEVSVPQGFDPNDVLELENGSEEKTATL